MRNLILTLFLFLAFGSYAQAPVDTLATASEQQVQQPTAVPLPTPADSLTNTGLRQVQQQLNGLSEEVRELERAQATAWWLLAGSWLAIVLLGFYLWQRHRSRSRARAGREKMTRDRDNALPMQPARDGSTTELPELRQRIGELEKTVAALSAREPGAAAEPVATEQPERRAPSKREERRRDRPAATPPAVAPASAPRHVIFAEVPQNEYFNRFSETHKPKRTLFEIIPDGDSGREGTLRLSEEQETRHHALAFTESIRSAVNLHGSGKPSPNARVEPGRVVKEGGLWKITQKVGIYW